MNDKELEQMREDMAAIYPKFEGRFSMQCANKLLAEVDRLKLELFDKDEEIGMLESEIHQPKTDRCHHSLGETCANCCHYKISTYIPVSTTITDDFVEDTKDRLDDLEGMIHDAVARWIAMHPRKGDNS